MRYAITRQIRQVNPYKTARTQEGLTLHNLTDLLSISRNTVIRTEAGQFTNPPQAIADYFPEVTYSDYLGWQRLKRIANYGLLFILPIPEYTFPTKFYQSPYLHIHPFTWWMSMTHGMNPNVIANAYCVSISTVEKFINTPERVSSVPEDLLFALLDSGYSKSLLYDLVLAYTGYKTYMNDRILEDSSVSLEVLNASAVN